MSYLSTLGNALAIRDSKSLRTCASSLMAYVRANSSCSACAKTSYTMASKSAVSSIISAISVGPAIWSIPTCPNKYFLAYATN